MDCEVLLHSLRVGVHLGQIAPVIQIDQLLLLSGAVAARLNRSIFPGLLPSLIGRVPLPCARWCRWQSSRSCS
jgi:hypothetical protein